MAAVACLAFCWQQHFAPVSTPPGETEEDIATQHRNDDGAVSDDATTEVNGRDATALSALLLPVVLHAAWEDPLPFLAQAAVRRTPAQTPDASGWCVTGAEAAEVFMKLFPLLKCGISRFQAKAGVIGRLLLARKDIEPRLECVDCYMALGNAAGRNPVVAGQIRDRLGFLSPAQWMERVSLRQLLGGLITFGLAPEEAVQWFVDMCSKFDTMDLFEEVIKEAHDMFLEDQSKKHSGSASAAGAGSLAANLCADAENLPNTVEHAQAHVRQLTDRLARTTGSEFDAAWSHLLWLLAGKTSIVANAIAYDRGLAKALIEAVVLHVKRAAAVLLHPPPSLPDGGGSSRSGPGAVAATSPAAIIAGAQARRLSALRALTSLAPMNPRAAFSTSMPKEVLTVLEPPELAWSDYELAATAVSVLGSATAIDPTIAGRLFHTGVPNAVTLIARCIRVPAPRVIGIAGNSAAVGTLSHMARADREGFLAHIADGAELVHKFTSLSLSSDVSCSSNQLLMPLVDLAMTASATVRMAALPGVWRDDYDRERERERKRQEADQQAELKALLAEEEAAAGQKRKGKKAASSTGSMPAAKAATSTKASSSTALLAGAQVAATSAVRIPPGEGPANNRAGNLKEVQNVQAADDNAATHSGGEARLVDGHVTMPGTSGVLVAAELIDVD